MAEKRRRSSEEAHGREREKKGSSLRDGNEGGKRKLSQGAKKRKALSKKYMPEKKKEQVLLRNKLRRELEKEKEKLALEEPLVPPLWEGIDDELLEEERMRHKKHRKGKGMAAKLAEERKSKIQGKLKREGMLVCLIALY